MLLFTRDIWKTLGEHAYERARYLWELYSRANPDYRPMLYLDIGTQRGYNALIFGKDASEIIAVDLRFSKNCSLKGNNKTSQIVADAQSFAV